MGLLKNFVWVPFALAVIYKSSFAQSCVHNDNIQPIDITQEFSKSFTNQASFSAQHLIEARNYHFILIPGLFSNLLNIIPSLTFHYFGNYKSWLTKRKIPFETLQVQSQSGPDHNRGIVKDSILQAKKPVVIIGHSYGGLYAISTLLHHPFLRKKVKGIIAIQSPLRGAGMAQSLKNTERLSGISQLFFTTLGGGIGGLYSLSYDYRCAHLEKWSSGLEQLAYKIPLLQITSETPNSIFQKIRPNEILSDGVVETQHQFINNKNTYRAHIIGWDHCETIAKPPFKIFAPHEDKQISLARTMVKSIIDLMNLHPKNTD